VGRPCQCFDDLEADPNNAPLRPHAGAGFDEVQQLADDCGITVIG